MVENETVEVLTSGTRPIVLRDRSHVIVLDIDDTADRMSTGIWPEPVIKQVGDSRGVMNGTVLVSTPL